MAAKNINPAAPQIRGAAANQLSERATTKPTSGAPINCPIAEACTCLASNFSATNFGFL